MKVLDIPDDFSSFTALTVEDRNVKFVLRVALQERPKTKNPASTIRDIRGDASLALYSSLVRRKSD